MRNEKRYEQAYPYMMNPMMNPYMMNPMMMYYMMYMMNPYMMNPMMGPMMNPMMGMNSPYLNPLTDEEE